MSEVSVIGAGALRLRLEGVEVPHKLFKLRALGCLGDILQDGTEAAANTSLRFSASGKFSPANQP